MLQEQGIMYPQAAIERSKVLDSADLSMFSQDVLVHARAVIMAHVDVSKADETTLNTVGFLIHEVGKGIRENNGLEEPKHLGRVEYLNAKEILVTLTEDAYIKAAIDEGYIDLDTLNRLRESIRESAHHIECTEEDPDNPDLNKVIRKLRAEGRLKDVEGYGTHYRKLTLRERLQGKKVAFEYIPLFK